VLKKIYDVSPGEDGWEVETHGASRASNRFGSKVDVVQRGGELAKGQI
jgi:hypothetical protein